MAISAQQVKELRDQTGAGMMECKAALQEAQGDLGGAVDILRKRGLAAAAKKTGRVAAEGAVGSYIHAGGRIGVLVEVNCETDFVAKTEGFMALIKDIAMHVAASSPRYIGREEVGAEIIEKEREIYREQALATGKPEKVIDRIVDGKLDRFYQEVCLLEQPFVKDPDRAVRDVVHEAVAKMGENIRIRRFARFGLGEDLEGRREDGAAPIEAQAGTEAQ